MKYLFVVMIAILAGCSVQEPVTLASPFDPIVAAGQEITSENWSQSDPTSGKVINETDSYWDIAFPIPDAVKSGEKPDHRIIRVFKKTKETKELGID